MGAQAWGHLYSRARYQGDREMLGARQAAVFPVLAFSVMWGSSVVLAGQCNLFKTEAANKHLTLSQVLHYILDTPSSQSHGLWIAEAGSLSALAVLGLFRTSQESSGMLMYPDITRCFPRRAAALHTRTHPFLQ